MFSKKQICYLEAVNPHQPLTTNAYHEVGDRLSSSSQSQEPRDIQQIYRRKSNLKKKEETNGPNSESNSSSDEIISLLTAQRTRKCIHSVVATGDKYMIVLKNDRQIQDIVNFCTTEDAGVLGVDI